MAKIPIPDRFPSATADRAVHAWQEIGIGEMMVQMHMEFTGRLDAGRLARAMDLAMDAEPVLGCRFVIDGKRAYWQRLDPGQRTALTVTQDGESFEAFAISPTRPGAGPMATACLWQAARGDRLLIKADHTAADAGGTKDIAAAICRMYNELCDNPDFRPEPNIAGSRSYAQIMKQLPWRAYPRIIWNYLHITKNNMFPAKSHGLWPEASTSGPMQYVVRHIPAGQAAALSAYARTHNAKLNDMLCAALHRAVMHVGQWDGRSQLRLQMTVDLRRWYMPGGRAQAVCNLSAYDYIHLGTDPGADFPATLDRVAAITRRRKASWFGIVEPCLHPLLRALPYPRLKAFFAWIMNDVIKKQNFPTVLTNMGPIDDDSITFGALRPDRAFLLVPPIYPPMIGIGLSGCRGALTLSAGVPQSTAPLIEDLFDQILEELPD